MSHTVPTVPTYSDVCCIVIWLFQAATVTHFSSELLFLWGKFHFLSFSDRSECLFSNESGFLQLSTWQHQQQCMMYCSRQCCDIYYFFLVRFLFFGPKSHFLMTLFGHSQDVHLVMSLTSFSAPLQRSWWAQHSDVTPFSQNIFDLFIYLW